MNPLEEAQQRVRSLGDFELKVDERGKCCMVTLSDESVGIFEQEISPSFDTPIDFLEWLNAVEDIFGYPRDLMQRKQERVDDLKCVIDELRAELDELTPSRYAAHPDMV